MKYMELILFMSCLFIFSLFFSKSIFQYNQISNKNDFYIENSNTNYFVSESFKNTCNGCGFHSLNHWQKVCKELCNLEYIAWSNVDEFLPDENGNINEVIYGVWKGKKAAGEIYCRRKL